MSDQIKRRPHREREDQFIGSAERGEGADQNPDSAAGDIKRYISFYLPNSLVLQIKARAKKETTGNASALAERVFAEYLGL